MIKYIQLSKYVNHTCITKYQQFLTVYRVLQLKAIKDFEWTNGLSIETMYF